jgi:hypothetical protein
VAEVARRDRLGRRHQRLDRLADPAVEEAGQEQADRRDAAERETQRRAPAGRDRPVDVGERNRDVEDAEDLLLGRVGVTARARARRLVGDRRDDAQAGRRRCREDARRPRRARPTASAWQPRTPAQLVDARSDQRRSGE